MRRTPSLLRLGRLAALAGAAACRDTVAEVAAPGGARRAVVFAADCGATCSASTSVSVLGSRAPLWPLARGNVAAAVAPRGVAPGTAWGGPGVRVRWRGADTLVVEYDARARLDRRGPPAGVAVVYRPAAWP